MGASLDSLQSSEVDLAENFVKGIAPLSDGPDAAPRHRQGPARRRGGGGGVAAARTEAPAPEVARPLVPVGLSPPSPVLRSVLLLDRFWPSEGVGQGQGGRRNGCQGLRTSPGHSVHPRFHLGAEATG